MNLMTPKTLAPPAVQFLVVCRTDRPSPRRKGHYVLATRRVFATMREAVAYKATIAASREPIVVEGRFDGLRFEIGDEWVIVAERESGLTIVRSGYRTAKEAGAARTELERTLGEFDTTNFLLLTRQQATQLLKEDAAQRLQQHLEEQRSPS